MLTHEKWVVRPGWEHLLLGLFPEPEKIQETTVGHKGEKLLWTSEKTYYVALWTKGGDGK